jgi:hypothetical protein
VLADTCGTVSPSYVVRTVNRYCFSGYFTSSYELVRISSPYKLTSYHRNSFPCSIRTTRTAVFIFVYEVNRSTMRVRLQGVNLRVCMYFVPVHQGRCATPAITGSFLCFFLGFLGARICLKREVSARFASKDVLKLSKRRSTNIRKTIK